MLPFYTVPSNDMDVGRNAIAYFHNRSLSYPGYKMSLNELMDAVSRGHADIFADSMGLAINQIGMSEGQVRDAMYALADQSAGRIPSTQNQFFQALSNRAQTLTFLDYVKGAPEIAAGIAKDSVDGLQKVGDSVISAGKFLTSPLGILSVVAVLAVVGIGYLKLGKIK